jgi:TRAP-type mannitol/chloroaromatic compound transport system permease small subunit
MNEGGAAKAPPGHEKCGGHPHVRLAASSARMKNFLFFIDELSTWVGKAFAWLILVLTLGVSYEVFMRYVLRAPTTWAFDISYIAYGAMFLMAGAYTLSRNGHVRADVVYRLWSPRTQATMDLVLYILFFLPAIAALMYSGWNYADMSVRFREVSIFSPAGVPVFPLKALIPATGVLLFLQGVAEIIRCVLCIRTGQWPQRLHDVEETESLVIRERQQAAAAQQDEKGAGA